MALSAADIAITRDYQGVVDELIDNNSMFFTNLCFPGIVTSEKDLITFDVETGSKRLTPFADPCTVAPLVERKGFKTYEFSPAYMMDRRKICCRTGQTRVKGEPIGDDWDIGRRRKEVLRQDAVDQLEMLDRRIEVMAAESLITGKVSIVGPNYPLRVVDFDRNPLNTQVLAGAARWNQPGVKGLTDLRTWALANQNRRGGYSRTVIMEPSVLEFFYEMPDVKNRLERFRGTDTLDPTGKSRGDTDRAVFHGTVDGFDIWTYQDDYVNDSNVVTNVMPTGQVLFGNPNLLMGKRYFGRIMDEEVNYKARPYAVKSWLETHPSARFGLLQSAAMVVQMRPNAFQSIKAY
jgi:Phage major capsid protein E